MAQHKGTCAACGRNNLTVFDDLDGKPHCRQCLIDPLSDEGMRLLADDALRHGREGLR